MDLHGESRIRRGRKQRDVLADVVGLVAQNRLPADLEPAGIIDQVERDPLPAEPIGHSDCGIRGRNVLDERGTDGFQLAGLERVALGRRSSG